jgi:transposase
MQIKSLRIKAYRSWAVDEHTPSEAVERLRKLEQIALLLEEGCSQATALAVVGCSRATYYRWKRAFERSGLSGLVAGSRRPCRVRQTQWTRQHEQQVWGLRRRFPNWGKRPIWRVLARDHGCELSESTIGRILAKGIRLGRIQPAWTARGPLRPHRRRPHRAHARRWRYGMKGRRPGELVQIDHMTVSYPDGRQIKEFKAICPVSKQLVARAYSRATAHNAQRFLEHLIRELPVPLVSIQVDGGSEFMAEFETACQSAGIALYVLPPRRPQYNGCVERANATTRYEFYPHYRGPLNLDAINRALKDYQDHYNGYRPHQALDLMTPNEYLQSLNVAA